MLYRAHRYLRRVDGSDGEGPALASEFEGQLPLIEQAVGDHFNYADALINTEAGGENAILQNFEAYRATLSGSGEMPTFQDVELWWRTELLETNVSGNGQSQKNYDALSKKYYVRKNYGRKKH